MTLDPSEPPSIAQGLPETRRQWPPEVLECAAKFIGGDVVADPPFFYFADPRFAVWEATRDYEAGSEGPEIVDASHVAPLFGVLTSQTCDIGEIDFEAPARPWVSIAPVYDMSMLNSGLRRLITRGGGPLHLLYLPSLANVRSGFWVADLRIEIPVEKSWLVGRSPIKGFADELAQREVCKRVALLRGRPAWAEVVSRIVQSRLLSEFTRMKAEKSDLFEACVAQISEIGARTDSMLTPTYLELAAFCNEHPTAEVRAWWSDTVNVLRIAGGHEGLAIHEPVIELLTECPVARYRQFEPVPLTRFSPN